MEKSLSKNSVYMLFYNVLNMIFPLLTGIYVAKVLLPSDVGKVAYAQNIVTYFVIFAFLGIPTYGLREVAKYKNDVEKLNKLFSELFIINFVSTLVFSAVYLAVVFSVKEMRASYELYLLVGMLIPLNILDFTWLFEGVEDFKFISVRNVAFKVVSFVLIVIFVKSSDDINLYAALLVLGSGGNFVLNAVYCNKVARFSFKGLSFKRHIKPIVFLVAVNLAIEIYMLVDVTMIGMFCDKESVAYYTYACKIYKVFLQIINTFTVVVIPKLTDRYKRGDTEEFNSLLSGTFYLLLYFAVPLVVGVAFKADSAILLLYGERYLPSANILRVLTVIVLFSPVGYLLGSRVCLVVGCEYKMIIAVFCGMVINVTLNYFFIKAFGAPGAAYASLCSELVVMVVYVILGSKYFKLKRNVPILVNIAVSACVTAAFLYGIGLLKLNPLADILVSVAGAMLVYFSTMLILKDKYLLTFLKKFKKS